MSDSTPEEPAGTPAEAARELVDKLTNDARVLG